MTCAGDGWRISLQREYDATVIGSGPNGLSAAITLARAGYSVVVIEAQDTLGGGTRSAELTLPRFVHDVCSTVFPMAIASPFFRSLPLAKHGLQWIHPPAPFAHPLDDGTAVLVERSIEETAANLGEDSGRYIQLMGPLVSEWPKLEPILSGPLRAIRHPMAASRLGIVAVRSASAFARTFRGTRARALWAGLAAHSVLPLDQVPSMAIGLVLGIAAHSGGWPIARGGSYKIADALAAHLKSLGGEIVTSMPVESLGQLPDSSMVLCDVTPRQLSKIAKDRLPEGFHRALARYRYGPGVCKLDWALAGPIPWKAEACRRAGTVHIGGTLEEIEASEREAWNGELSEKPFVLLAQPTLFDETRSPEGKHTAWAYCHVPNGSSFDMTERIENQIERFAPGFREQILKRSVMVCSDLEAHNANLVGGDITGGALLLKQFMLRPTWRRYRTPAKGLYLCSSSTPPGGGVHGLCGHLAAIAALRDQA
jgi:phytoene dehydrogenase-like protein